MPADAVGGAELGEPGPPAGYGALRPGGGQPVAGQLVLQVALELPDGDEDVDQHGGGRVGGGQVGEVRQSAGEHPQFHLVLLAPGADGEDVGQVAAQPVQLGDGELVAGPGEACQLPKAGTLQRRHLGAGILEEVARSPKSRTPSAPTASPASPSTCVCRWVLCSSVETRV
jgi:hypothetical protein